MMITTRIQNTVEGEASCTDERYLFLRKLQHNISIIMKNNPCCKSLETKCLLSFRSLRSDLKKGKIVS